MSSILSLPKELIEHIASYLTLEDVCALRLREPSYFPARTIEALRRKHPWNAADITKRNVNGRCDYVFDVDKDEAETGFWGMRSAEWGSTLITLSKHSMFGTWITSVCIARREVSDATGDYRTSVLETTGLGYAISTLPNLHCLWVIGETSSYENKVVCVLKDLLDSPHKPPIQNFIINHLDSGQDLVGALLKKFNDSLRWVELKRVKVNQGYWRKEIIPALATCTLNGLVISQPLIFHKLIGAQRLVAFRDIEAAASDVCLPDGGHECRPGESFWIDAGDMVQYGVEFITSAECSQGLQWLQKSYEMLVGSVRR